MVLHWGGCPGDFDIAALFEVADAQREARGMSWRQLNKALAWGSYPGFARMRDTHVADCNGVLPLVQWVGRTPESFTVDPEGAVHELLPDPADTTLVLVSTWPTPRRAEGRWRWWWAHHDLAAEIDERRQAREMTWDDVAAEMAVPVKWVKGLGKGRYGPPIGLAMIAARWVQRSAASFMTELPPAVFNS